MKCEHDLAEMETSCADGLCPNCLQVENKNLRELAKLRGKLLICYRVGKQPSGKLLDRLYILGKFEETLT